jgi:hypothetical protein
MNEFKQLIENIFNLDQQLRKQNIWGVESIKAFNETISLLLKEAVKTQGIPTPMLVGQETADEFIVLLSHCTDLNFVHSVLETDVFTKANFNKENIAIVTDNLLVKEGKKQRFGTVLKAVEKENGEIESIPMPIEDEENIDKRRKENGIKTTLEDYIKVSNELFKKIKR